ncbi:DUF937 domain-containing protein [Gordonia sp. CPCC 205333]|uniref:DUF937 domain-containing protein n=1 Tax=Gordonia sp. CPCC 205333 TaxID=3140790 RepID=UPI003AF39AAE
MSDLDDLLKQISVDDLAAQLGVESAEADAAVKQAVPALLHGLQTTAETGDGTADLEAAVKDDDGDKIVASLFGEKTDDVANALSDQVPAAAVDQGLVKKLLPILAPIVISFVLKKLSSGQNASGEQSGGGGLGDILSGALGGGNNDGGALGSILGGLLGGGSSGGAGGALGSILGGLLGGKK